MFRAVVLAGPFAAVGQFHTKKVAYPLITAVAYGAEQFAIAVANGNGCSAGNSAFNLKANAGKRDVFQVGHAALLTTSGVLPAKLNQLSAEHTVGFAAVFCFLHTIHIGSCFRDT